MILSRVSPLRATWARFVVWPLLLLAAAAAWARPLPEADAWPHEQSDLQPDPNVIYGRLPNGMRYVLMPNDTPKDRISLRLLVTAGSLMEDDDQRGLAHFLEHMAFKGSENLPAGDLVQYLERLGMAFGADTNARTSFESTVYQLELPSNDEQMIASSLKIMRETANRLLIPAAEVDKERGVILSEKRLRNSPEYRSFTADLQFLLPKSLIPKREPIGAENVISAAPRDRFVDFYRTWYRPQRVTLVAVGKLDPAEFAKQIEAQFASFNERSPAKPNPDLGTIEPRGPSARLYSDPDAQTRVSLQSATYADPGVDTQASQAKDVALYLANAVISRRLTSLALQGNAGFTSGSAQSTDLLRFARISTVTLQTRPEEWKKALGVAEQELRRALTYGFTDAELEEQKTTLLSMYEQQAKAATTRESPQLANEIVDHLTAFNVVTSPQYDVTQLEHILPDITPARAQEVLGELWKDGPLIFVSGPLNVPQPEAEILQVFETSRAQKVAPQAAGELQKFAYTDFGKPTAVLEKKMAPALEVTQIRFGNNVRLNLKRTPFDANSILVGLRFGGGRLDLPKDKAALKLLADGTFVAGGLEKHSLDELNRINAGRHIGLNFSVDDDAFVFSGQTTPQDLLLQLQVMAAYLTAPGYRAQALERFHQNLGQLYLNLTHTPSGVLQSRVARLLRSGDPRFGYPERAEVEKLTLADLKAWLSGPLANSYLEISLVGDFDPDQALQAVASTFGSLPERSATKPPYTSERQLQFPSERSERALNFEGRDPKALATVYWPTTDFSRVSEVRRLFVLAKVLESRILDRIRGQQGLSYSVQAAHNPSVAFPNYGLLYALVDAAPDKAQALSSQMREIAGEIAAGGVTQDELERARNPIVNELKKLLRENGYLLNAIVGPSQEQPERLLRATTSVAELESITVDDLNGVARKYLQGKDGLPVLIVPSNTNDKQPKASTQPRETALEN